MNREDKISEIEIAFANFMIRLNPSIEESAELAVRIGKVIDNHVTWKTHFESVRRPVYGESVKRVLAELEELQKIKKATLLAINKNPSAYEGGPSVSGRDSDQNKGGA